jgi:hypothetical protein
LRSPWGIAIGPDDSLYVTEWGNNRVQKFALGVPGWVQENINGFGERENNNITTIAPFGNLLYAGTYNWSGNGAQLWQMDTSGNWTMVMNNGFGDASNRGIDHLMEFNGNLYAGIWNETDTSPYTSGGEVWRFNGSSWTQVVDNGFSDPTNGEVMRLGVFNSQIYAGTWSYTSTHGAEIWRSSTGNAGDWSQVAANGFGDPTNQGIPTMEEFNGALYVGTYSSGSSGPTGAEIWRSYDGIAWSPVITDGFGYEGTYSISTLENFDGYLYAGIGRWDSSTKTYPGGQVWRCAQSSDCDESTDWNVVVSNGFGNTDNLNITALYTFNDRLYALAVNTQTGMEIWRTADGTNWEQVGFAGLGDSNNLGPYWDNAMTIFNNRLFIGTVNGANGGEVWLYLHNQVYLPLVLR